MTRRHANVPVFIPHLGCPNMCVFCDQKTISGTECFSEEKVDREIREALATIGNRSAEIAFFGGSFTGIDRGLMIRLLDTAEKYVASGEVIGIRMSTRPDYIDEEIIDVLGRYTVTEVELGVQSMSDAVLKASKRGHTSETTERACALLKAAGIPFVGQMMIGLPGADGESERE
ncbi:MAG: radical SAM protein, partial [Clostridia bacterium]|nr:radical SAM protein [Clostridia bacterium]